MTEWFVVVYFLINKPKVENQGWTGLEFFSIVESQASIVCWASAEHVALWKLFLVLNMDLDSTLFKNECLSLEELHVSDYTDAPRRPGKSLTAHFT